MVGRSYQRGSVYGLIWCKKRFDKTPDMDPHPSMTMRITMPYLEWKIKGKGIHPIPN